MTLQIIRALHTEECAQAMEAWIQAWDQDHRAGLILQALKARWERAARRCSVCFGHHNGHVRPGHDLRGPSQN